ncbi:tyrosine-protein phosphatase [Streptomyces capparidis]
MSQETTHETVPAEPTLSGVRNFRDVGGLPTVDGYRVAHGRLFRSGHLAHATGEDAAFLSGLGLRTVFDLRNDADIALEGPDVELPGVRNVRMPLNDPADGAEFWRIVRDGEITALRDALGGGRAERRMAAAYRDIVVGRTAELGRLLRTLAEDDGLPALLHCAAGKDRAGLSVVMVLLAVGVEPAAIQADYLESNAAHRRYRIRRDADGAGGPSPEAMELLSPLFEARAEYLDVAMTAISEGWGSPERYLREALGCGPELREQLRERLLDGVV